MSVGSNHSDDRGRCSDANTPTHCYAGTSAGRCRPDRPWHRDRRPEREDAGLTASSATFAPGSRCHFVVTNHGTQPHQFWVMPQTMQQMMQNMPMTKWHQQLLYSSQTILPGHMVSFDYTFPLMSTQQALAFGCYTEQRQAVSMMPIRISSS